MEEIPEGDILENRRGEALGVSCNGQLKFVPWGKCDELRSDWKCSPDPDNNRKESHSWVLSSAHA